VAIFDCVVCHNFIPSITIIMKINVFEKIIVSKNLHNAMCQTLITGWQLMTLAWHHGCNYNGVA
jgi:hypothetical protein